MKKILIVFLCILFTTNSVFAFSNCQIKYDSHKRSLPQFRGMCNVCHLSPSGSGPQNEFGRAFAENGFKITDDLIAKFPQFFQPLKEETSMTDDSSDVQPTVADTKPFISRVKPKSVKVNVQSMLQVMGRNFVDGSKAFIDNNEVLTTFRTNMLLLIDFILTTVGLHDLKVKNPDEQESNTVMIRAK